MKNSGRKRKLIIQGITCLVFVCFIFLLTFINLFAPKVYFSDNENRALSPGVDAGIKNILFGSFDTDFETWFSDHFVFRDSWIKIKASLRKDLGSIENNGVYFSHDGRLIQQFLTYDEKIVEDNISYLEEFSHDNNVTLNVMLVPGASAGEKGYLPFGAANVDEKQLIAGIGEKLKDQNFIDLTALMNPKDDNYFKTDHHWNHNGAKIGYDAICKNVLKKEVGTFKLTKVSDSFKGTMYSKSGAFWTKPDTIFRMDPANGIKVRVQYDGGRETESLFEDKNLKIKDQYTYYLDGNHGYVHITTDVPNKKKAILIKDSYSHILIPYLAAEYSELEIFDLRYYHDQVSTHIKDRTETDIYVIYGIETFCSDTNLAILW
jgi:hypothetical protein